VSESEIEAVIEEIKSMPIPTDQKIQLLQAWGKENGVEITDEHIQKLLS
jgi:hypothetical protein